MGTQTIQLGYDKDAAWSKGAGRKSVFLDTNAWIEMRNGATVSARNVRSRLKELVEGGEVFCPLSWGLLEELFKLTGDYLNRSAALMEELSLNIIYVNREEVYQWEVARSLRRALGQPVEDTLRGLFTPPAAFVGSRFSLQLHNVSLGSSAEAHLREYMKRELGKIGVADLANTMTMGGRIKDETPPAYSEAAKNCRNLFKGDKRKLFIMEAGEIFSMYVTPFLMRQPPELMIAWMKHYGRPGDEERFFRDCLVHLPALHNFIDIMVEADLQPDKKDKYNDFMDYEIMTAPLAYSTVFVSRDKGIRHLLRHRTGILDRTACHYCDGLEALEERLVDEFD